MWLSPAIDGLAYRIKQNINGTQLMSNIQRNDEMPLEQLDTLFTGGEGVHVHVGKNGRNRIGANE